jgi:trehalose 6-phosphate phosphatase
VLRHGGPHGPVLPLDRVTAVIFDLDGVITDTASVHAAAWKRLFDEYLRDRSERTGMPFEEFDPRDDYRRYVDGKPRYDGVRSFLGSRGVHLPDGTPADPPGGDTICALGNRKNRYFLDRLRDRGAEPYPSTVALARELRSRGVRVAVISSSKNMSEVLEAAGVAELFDVRVDGVVAEALGLPGKPDPAVFEEAARRLRVRPSQAAVVEDALAGVRAGRRGGFGFVLGVDREGSVDLLEAGADAVVRDLSELSVPAEPTVGALPIALDRVDEVRAALRGRRPAIFLDYDGTLTPIVGRPEDAVLAPATRASIERLAKEAPVAVVSGRDLADVRRMTGVEGIAYAGSHGLDLLGPDGSTRQLGRDFLPELDAAEDELVVRARDVPGARVERKAFAIAVHVRQVEEDRLGQVEAAVADVAAAHPRLRRTGGKRIFELRPDVAWDKGKALAWLLDVLGLEGEDVLPVYVGDDETDEDAFRVVRSGGLGVVVRGERDDRPTLARYALRDTEETRAFLDLIVAELTEAGGRE